MSKSTVRKRHITYLAPKLLENGIEVSVHSCPRALQAEVRHIFKNLDVEGTKNLLAITTSQKTNTNMVFWGEEQAQEKDRLLEKFMMWANQIYDVLSEKGYFVDIIDPCSGTPVHTPTNTVYAEVDGCELLLGYSTTNCGCCKLLSHPIWDTNVYPATMFTTAPPDLVVETIQSMSKLS